MMDEYGKFTKSIIESGNFKAGDALQPTSTATTVRIKDGKPVTTHGPFAETREALIGYYLIDAKDIDQAFGIAAACLLRRPARSKFVRSWCTTSPESPPC